MKPESDTAAKRKPNTIQVDRVNKSYAGENVLKDLSFDVKEGETFGIIGPNGSGKSTLLKLLSGVERADGGSVRLFGEPVAAYSPRQLARRVAVLQQEALPPVGFTVREVVEMGRYPFQNWLGSEERDRTPLIHDIMTRLELHPLASRTLIELSGGERQRVALGKVMAQQPELLMLDEPTTYLDIGYQVQMMDYIEKWKRESGITVVAVLHDLNLAAQYCDRLLVLHHGEMVRLGTPKEVVEDRLIADVYRTRPVVLNHPTRQIPQILLQSGLQKEV